MDRSGGKRPGRTEEDGHWATPRADPGERGEGHVHPGRANAAGSVAVLVESERRRAIVAGQRILIAEDPLPPDLREALTLIR